MSDKQAEADKAPSSAWLALAVLVAVSIFASLDRQVLTIALEPVRKTFALTDLQIGMLQGLGLTLAATDVISVYAASASVAFSAYGVEIT